MTAAACKANIPDDGFLCGTGMPQCPPGMMCSAAGYCTTHADAGVVIDMANGSIYGNGALGDPSPMLAGKIGRLELNSETGEIDLIVNNVRTMVIAPMANGFVQSPQTNGPGVATWSFSNLVVPAGITVVPAGGNLRVPVLESMGALTIKGTINVNGFGGKGGFSGLAGGDIIGGMTAGGGGGALGTDGSGGGGGGYNGAGTKGTGAAGGAPGMGYGDDSLIPTNFGAGGGGGSGAGNKGGTGGAGGGAIVLFGMTVEIDGLIDVGGERGHIASSSMPAGGGGGGSGGSLLISGNMVLFNGGGSGDGGVANAELRSLGGQGGDPAAAGGSAGGPGAEGRITIASGNIVNRSQLPPLEGTIKTMTTVLTTYPR